MHDSPQSNFKDDLHDKFVDEILRKQNYDRITGRDYHDYICQNKKYDQKFRDICLTESDFYLPSDNRFWKSSVEDIDGGDNFADYCEEFFRLCEEEGFYDN